MRYIGLITFPDSKIHGANMGPIWGRQNPGGPHVGPMNFVILVYIPRRVFIPYVGRRFIVRCREVSESRV